MIRFLGVVCMAMASAVVAQPVLNLPARRANAPTGSQFYQQILNLSSTAREQAIIDEIARGNIPSWLRPLKPITATGIVSGASKSVTVYVTCDYMAIGSDDDFFRMPMSAPLAQQVADMVGCSLTTRKLVNDIYTQSQVKLAPYPFSPTNYVIDSVQVFYLSQQAIENQRASYADGLLVGGIKKDVVVTKRLSEVAVSPRAFIYGWHQLNGSPIQPLSAAHEASYEDYSHGIRLVLNQINVDGTVMTVPQIVTSATLHPLLSDEGAFTLNVYPIPNPYVVNVAPNLIQNPGFEETFSGTTAPSWEQWTAPGSATITFGRASVNRDEGVASHYFARADTAPFDGGIRQRVTVTPGARYRLTARMKRQSTFVGTRIEIGYDPTGGNDPIGPDVVYTSLLDTADNVWASYQQDFLARSSSVVVLARGGHTGTTGGTNAYFYVDTFTLTELAPPQAQGLMLE